MPASVEEIRARFDADVERFANRETGQTATVDARLVLDLLVETAAATTPNATAMLDLGCGAGNYTLALLEQLPGLSVTLVDLSLPMLERATERVQAAGASAVHPLQGDMRDRDFGQQSFDIIVAGAVLHHLRGEDEWRSVYSKLFAALRPGGSLWVADLIAHDAPAVDAVMQRRYGAYLAALRDEAYRDHVLAYIAHEDTPRSLTFQLDLMRSVGFTGVEVLHKHLCFAAFGGVRNGR